MLVWLLTCVAAAAINVANAAAIPSDRLPSLGFWNPGVVSTNGLTYRQSGTFNAPINLTNLVNAKNSPYNAAGDGTTDDTTAIQRALTNQSSVIYLPAGTYKITGQLQLANPTYPWEFYPKILRGAGPTNTFIKSHSATGPLIDASGSGPGYERSVALSTDGARGDTTITLSAWDSYFTGAAIGVLYQSNSVAGPPWDHSPSYMINTRCQLLHITNRNVSAKTVTFNSPLYLDWPASNSYFTLIYSSGSSIGIEDLSVENAGGANTHTIRFAGIANSWIANCEVKNAVKWHVRFDNVVRSTILGCYIHGYYPVGGNGGGDSVYGVGLYGHSTDNLVLNNIFDRTRHAMITEYGGQGNVFAYNCSVHPINEGQESTDYLMGDMIQHGGGSAFNLWEGNAASTFRLDNVLGGSTHNVNFRSFAHRSGLPAVIVGKWGIDLQTSNFWVSAVGAVLAKVNYNPSVRIGAPDGNGDVRGVDFAVPDATADPLPTYYEHGVVDLETNQVRWVSTNADHALPNSLFLTSKPSFFAATNAWPPFGPDVSGYTNWIPAVSRYVSGDYYMYPTPAGAKHINRAVVGAMRVGP